MRIPATPDSGVVLTAYSFADPAEPSPEFLREQEEDREDALRTHRYTSVFLLTRPRQAVQGNGDKPSN